MIRKRIVSFVASSALALGAMGVVGVLTLSPSNAQSITSAPTPSEDLSRLQERVGDLERLLQQATGENERLSIELRRAKAENQRLERLLNDALGQAQPPAANAAPAAPSVTGQLGTLPQAAAPIDSAQQLREATGYLQRGRFAEAEAAFTAYAQANPQSPDTPEARYFIGRTQVAQRRFQEAGETFVKFLSDYPTAARAPDAWTMLGVALKGMDKIEQACGVFRDLPVKYPRASAAARNLATSEARAANCR